MPFDKFEVMSVQEALSRYVLADYMPLPVSKLYESVISVSSDAVTAVTESDYIDVDYSASYHDQLGRSFTPVKRETTRIHFFDVELTRRRLMNASDATVRAMQSNYLGFTVIRPDYPTTLGRTLLKYPDQVNGRPARFPTRGTTPVDLAGIPLSVESCPYMSQDQKVMACATAALWMAATPLAEKVPEIAWHSTAHITRMAMSIDRPFGPVLGRRGLSLQEMQHALLEIGFDPSIHPNPTPEDLVDLCHLYADSGIPPVLVVATDAGWHAVTVVGYTLKSPATTAPDGVDLIPAHHFVSDLIIHDDQRGMYLPASVTKSSKASSPEAAELVLEIEGETEMLSCQAVLVPLPTRVMLDEQGVRVQSNVWINWAKGRGLLEDRKVVTRNILVRSNTLKQTLQERRERTGQTGYPEFLVRFARGLPMPRYVWLVEVSYWDNWDPADPNSPPVVADLVLDSTSTERLRPDYLLLHFPHLALGRQQTDGTVERPWVSHQRDLPHPPFPNIPRP